MYVCVFVFVCVVIEQIMEALFRNPHCQCGAARDGRREREREREGTERADSATILGFEDKALCLLF